MNLQNVLRSRLALVLLVLAFALTAGCSKSPTKVEIKPKPIPHADADDIVQILGTTISADNGGWYFTIKAFCDSLSVPAPNVIANGAGRAWAMPLSARPGIRNNFSITRAGVTYNFQVGYGNDSTVTSTRDTSSIDLLALVGADGGSFASQNGLVESTYGCHTYTTTSPSDSFFAVANIQAGASDTLEFTGSFYDSSFALVHSSIAPSSDRLWFLCGDTPNLFEYTLRILKSRLSSAPYPINDQSQVTWLIEAKGLNSRARNNWSLDHLVEARMTFDGTADATLRLGDVFPDPNWQYVYKVNLNTGVFTRAD